MKRDLPDSTKTAGKAINSRQNRLDCNAIIRDWKDDLGWNEFRG